MNPLNRVGLADCPDRPWRNGGGTTRELLAWPSGELWSLRLSVARIASDGPFSAYPGVERHFVVLEGAGVQLRWASAEQQLVPGDPPLSFDGADAPQCTLCGGATRDLNLMVVRDHGTGRLRQARPGDPWTCPSAWRGVYAEGRTLLRRTHADATSASVDDVADVAELAAGTLLWSEAAAGETWTLGGDAAAWWIEFGCRDAAARQGDVR